MACVGDRSGQLHALGRQHVDQSDQGKAYQARRIWAFGAAEQADAQSFCLETARAVIRLFCMEIAADACLIERAHVHGTGGAGWARRTLARPGLGMSSSYGEVNERVVNPGESTDVAESVGVYQVGYAHATRRVQA